MENCWSSRYMLGVFFDGNSFILYVGTSLRFLFLRYVCRKDVHFKQLLHGKKDVKANDLYNFDNEMANRSWGCGFLFFVIGVIILLQALRII